MQRWRTILSAVAAALALAGPALAAPFSFTTGSPDGKIAFATRPATGAPFEIESADDFILTNRTRINHASFTGLVTGGGTIGQVVVEIYRVFPKDSTFPPSGNVPTRNNSPSDVELDDRNSAGGNLSFKTSVLANSFTTANSIQPGGIPDPPQSKTPFTGGDGPVSGQEVQFDVTFTTPFDLPADHYFFVPQVQVTGGDFLWLSAPFPQFQGDLQVWTRNSALQPDWLRVGTDIVGGDKFNASFSLNGATVPEPGSMTLMVLGAAGIALGAWRRRCVA
jgi:hypothetical protein